MCGSSQKTSTPDVVPEAAQLPTAPTTGATGTASSSDARRRAAATGAGRAGTILTGSRGVTDEGQTASKTLLGQ